MMSRVEFCGVPASGKSTLCAGAIRRLQTRGRRVLSRAALVEQGVRARDHGWVANALAACLPRWRRVFLGVPHGLNDWHRFAVDYPGFAARLHDWLAEGAVDETWRSCVLYSVLTSAFEFQLARDAAHPMLLDEGFAQRFFTVRGYRGLGRCEDAALYAAAMPLPAGVVWVTAPAEVCLERLHRRGRTPLLLQHEPESMRPVRLEEGHGLLAALAAELKQRGVKVLRVDGAGNVDREILKVAEFVEACL